MTFRKLPATADNMLKYFDINKPPLTLILSPQGRGEGEGFCLKR